MDLLVEKLDGSRYYLSQYKVLITEFEESAPSVTRNSKQLDQRNGNIDFGGWHTDKTINVTGYYRADDMDEEEMLRERLYALLSDPDGYYITQLKTTPSVAMERPGETSGGYYDKLNNYPSHKRFLVYTEAPEMELVGNVNGTLLYKLTAEFKTMKLPYGESVSHDLDVKPNVTYYFDDVGLKEDHSSQGTPGKPVTDGKTPYLHTAYSWSADGTDRFTTVYPGDNLVSGTNQEYAMGYGIPNTSWTDGYAYAKLPTTIIDNGEIIPQGPHTFWYTLTQGVTYTQTIWFETDATVKDLSVVQITWFTNVLGHDFQPAMIQKLGQNSYKIVSTYTCPGKSDNSVRLFDIENLYYAFDLSTGTYLKFGKLKLATPYTPSPLDDPEGAYPKFIGTYTDYIADDSTDPSKYTWALTKVEDGNDGLSGYNKWYFDTYYNTNNLAIPYSGTVPCNQLEQGFAIELTAKEASSSLSFKIDDTELTYSGAVASGDVFIFSGFSYTQNGLSIVSKTNKAYFILQPDKPNRITCNVPGTVRIIGLQNLYA